MPLSIGKSFWKPIPRQPDFVEGSQRIPLKFGEKVCAFSQFRRWQLIVWNHLVSKMFHIYIYCIYTLHVYEIYDTWHDMFVWKKVLSWLVLMLPLWADFGDPSRLPNPSVTSGWIGEVTGVSDAGGRVACWAGEVLKFGSPNINGNIIESPN